MFAYTLAILYRYVYPNVNILYGILLNAELPSTDFLDKLITLSPFVGGFVIGAFIVRWHYESQKTEQKTQSEEVNKKIKELSDQHVEEFKTLSEQQQVRYDKEMAAKDEQIKAKDIANQNLVDLWHQAIQSGIEAKDKAVQEGIISKDKSLEGLRNYYDAIINKKDEIIANDKIYIREKEAEMKQTLIDLEHVVETINNYLLREHTENSKDIFNKIEKLSTTIDLLYKKLDTSK